MPLDKKVEEDSRVDGLAVKVRGTPYTIHADGSVTQKPRQTDGELQHRADVGAMETSLGG